jgi:hypothetical protein
LWPQCVTVWLTLRKRVSGSEHRMELLLHCLLFHSLLFHLLSLHVSLLVFSYSLICLFLFSHISIRALIAHGSCHFIDPRLAATPAIHPGKARLITSIAIRFVSGSTLALCHTENRPSPDKFRVTPPSSLCNPKVLTLRSAWHSSGAIVVERIVSRPLET